MSLARFRQHKRLKVLIVYHAAVLESSRKIFEALATDKEIKLRVLGPRKGFNPLRKQVFEITQPFHGDYDLVPGRVYRAKKNFSGPYLTGLLRQMLFFRPDVIHIFNEAYSLVNIQAIVYRNIFRPRAKCYAHGVENIISKEACRPRAKARRRFAQKYCDGVACWSMSAYKALKGSGFPEKKMKVAYWGIPLDLFFPARNEKLRSELTISEKFVVGYVGRLQPEKGLSTLLMALQRLPDSVSLLYVGDGYWQKAFNEQVERLGLVNRVHRASRVAEKQVPKYMNAMDVLILPSETAPRWQEQFGRVLPEAMACGLPVIGSDSGSIPEIIGDAGLIFKQGDHKALAEKITQLKDNFELYQQLKTKGIERSQKMFSCKSYAKRLRDMYWKL